MMKQVRMICAVVTVLLLLLASNVASAGWLSQDCSPPCISGDESIMSPKEHGTSHTPVQSNLRWDCDGKLADRICNFNRHYAEVRPTTALEVSRTTSGSNARHGYVLDSLFSLKTALSFYHPST
jgi:hypothetical protein